MTLLSHHVLQVRLTYDDMVGGVRDYTSLAGQTLTIDAAELVRIGDAAMVETDIQAENGVLHVIDQVLPIAEP